MNYTDLQEALRNKDIAELVQLCSSFTMEMLNALTDAELSRIEGVDTNWCYECVNHVYPEPGENKEVDENVSAALYSEYEEIQKEKGLPY